MRHMPILHLNFISFILGEISIVLQSGCIIYGVIYSWIELVLNFRSGCLNILVVMSFILKVNV